MNDGFENAHEFSYFRQFLLYCNGVRTCRLLLCVTIEGDSLIYRKLPAPTDIWQMIFYKQFDVVIDRGRVA